MSLIQAIKDTFTAIGNDIRLARNRLAAIEAGGPVAGIEAITTTITGSIEMPYVGPVRRYMRLHRTFQSAIIGVSVPPASPVVVSIKKNGVEAATITLPANNAYASSVINFDVEPGDYLTVEMSGGATANVVISLD